MIPSSASQSTSQSYGMANSLAQSENIYYYGSKTMKKQSISTVQKTNFTQSLASLSGGQSVITFSPDSGLGTIILGVQLKAPSTPTAYDGLAVNRGFAYDCIESVQWRYGSSSTYQKSGAQILVETIATAGSQSEANNLITLGGNALTTTAQFAGDNLFGYAVIALPHCGAQSGTEAPNPLPTELLSAPLVITVTLKRQVDVFKRSTNATGTAPLALDEAYLQFRQIMPMDRSELMKISPSVTYPFPITFFQQENQISFDNAAGTQERVLNGFIAGSCKGIHCWLVDESDTVNPFRFIQPRDLTLSYAGNVIHNYKGVSGQILDTLFCDVPSYFNNSKLTQNVGGTSFVTTDEISAWTHFPFSQRFEQLSAEYMTTSGIGISNGSVNIRLSLTPGAAGAQFRLYFVPYYASILLFNNGSCEYVF